MATVVLVNLPPSGIFEFLDQREQREVSYGEPLGIRVGELHSTERVTIGSRIRREAHRVGWEPGHPNGNALFGRATLAVCGALEASLELAVLRSSPNPSRILLFDRHAPTWEAIAGLDGEPLSPGLVATLGRLPPLDLEIFLDVDVDVAAARVLGRNGALRGRF